MNSVPESSAKKSILTFSFLGFVLLALLWLMTGCWIPYREVRPSLNVDYDNQDFIAVVEVESGYRTWNPIGERLSHGHRDRSYARRTYDYVMVRWDAHDGHLLSIEPFATGDHERNRLIGVASDTVIMYDEVHRRENGSWHQVNAGREYRHWSGRDDLGECFSLDRHLHLYQEADRIESREVATGKVVASRAIDQAWKKFLEQVQVRPLDRFFMDSEGYRVLGFANRHDPDGQEQVVIFDLRDGSTRIVPIDPALLKKEARADLTLITTMDLVEGELRFLVESSEPFSLDKQMMIRLRVVTEKNVVLYDNAWRHEYQTEIEWRPRESLLLMSDTTRESGLDDKQTRITRIDYTTGQETSFPIAYPSGGAVIRQRPAH